MSRLFLRVLCGLRTWVLCCCLGGAAALAHAAPLEPVYLYSSPITRSFFAANGSNYDELKARWRQYLVRFGKSYREVSRADLLKGLKPGVLVLGSAVLLDDAERQAIKAFADKGGSLVGTWGTGARDGSGRWKGFGFLEEVFDTKVVGALAVEDEEHFVNTFGDSPITWGLPAGMRIFLGLVAETPLRVQGPNLSGRYTNWSRSPKDPATNGAITYVERNGSRRVYLGFSESSWEFDDRLELPKALDSLMAWARREPKVFKAAWPHGELSAQLLEMDTEDRYQNSVNFARDLDSAGIRGTFYSLTSIAKNYGDTVRKLSERHEIGYHAEVHVGFKGKAPEAQKERLQIMFDDMRGIVGSRAQAKVTGFRAPTESWDEHTERLLRTFGVTHHVADPASSDARVPFFSTSEAGLTTEEAIVVLPRTQMDDLNYLALKLPIDRATALITQDFDYLHEAGALGVLSVHSQNYAEDGLMAKLTPPYIKRLQAFKHEVWSVSGAEIADWWRSRARVVQPTVPLGRADDRLVFEVKPPGQVVGLTFLVTHPSIDKPLKAATSTSGTRAVASIERIDAQRSAVVFKGELAAGRYGFDLAF